MTSGGSVPDEMDAMAETVELWQTPLASAERRIQQLEAALARRTELLERTRAELTALRQSKAVRAALFTQRVVDRLFPLHTRRRELLKSLLQRLTALGLRGLQAIKPSFQESLGSLGHRESTPVEEYRRWIARHEPGPASLARQRTHRFPFSPTISIVTPVCHPPLAFLRELVDSLRAQTYPHWEWCVADGGSGSAVQALLRQAAEQDPRIRLRFLSANRGIAGNTNAALEWATGDFVAFVDHDDVLAPFALHEVAAAVNAHPEADVLYSDEDKLDPYGRRVEPAFKPDWSPETLLARNYMCHLVVIRRGLLEQIGGVREGFDGAQDHDLLLRATEQARQVVHIPQVLYHWRMHEQSTAGNMASKAYASESGRRAVAEALARRKIAASVCEGACPGMYRIIPHLADSPLLSVIIPNRDSPDLLARCLESLRRSSYRDYEVLVVENGSRQPETFQYYDELRRQPGVRILEWHQPFNYAAVNNFAAAQARGELLLFLNNDTEFITADALEELVRWGQWPGVGAVGAKLYYADETIQHAGLVIGMGGVAGHSHLGYPREAPGYMQRLRYVQNVSAVTGACLLVPRRVFDEVGGFDEGFVLAFNDVDLCLAILTGGYRIVWTPHAELYHWESKTRGYEDTPEKLARFRRECELFHAKWGEFLQRGDPYYNPHFRLDRSDFALKAA